MPYRDIISYFIQKAGLVLSKD